MVKNKDHRVRGHAVHKATVGVNVAGVHAVINYITQEQRAGDKAV
jgi:hypothetical protein